jgi:membrane-associated protein
MDFLHELKTWLNPETIVNVGGIYLLAFVIFAETGLLVGFFLPGDSLLFTAGLLATPMVEGHPAIFDINVGVMILVLTLSAIIGNLVGYAFGYYSGPKLFSREDSLIFKKKYLISTEKFYAKHGAMALVGGRFIPIIRTFVPILAGAIKLDFKRFVVLNVLGAVAWVPSMVIAGYLLGKIEWVRHNLEFIVIGLILVTIIPVIKTVITERMEAKKHQQDADNQ